MTMTTPTLAVDETCAPPTFDEALEVLWSGNARWSSGNWIFRGQRDGNWPLLPLAYRKEAVLFDGQQYHSGPRDKVLAQLQAEWRTLRAFLARVDATGLPFASADEAMHDHVFLRNKYEPLFNRIRSGETELWPFPDLLPNLALAQHYGVSTRLLDWSTRAEVSTYFAAAGAAIEAKGGATGTAAVWALNTEFLDFCANERSSFARVVRVPRAHNPNLHAQSGVFTNYWSYGATAKPADKFQPQSLDGVVRDAWAHLARRSTPPTELSSYVHSLVKIEFPIQWAGKLLERLGQQGVTAGELEPGYAGAAKSFLERANW